jgi:hypothetical protein
MTIQVSPRSTSRAVLLPARTATLAAPENVTMDQITAALDIELCIEADRRPVLLRHRDDVRILAFEGGSIARHAVLGAS